MDHCTAPLRTIRELGREVLRDLDRDFHTRYSTTGHPSIPPEQLLSTLLMHMCYGVRSERHLMELPGYNLLSRWFVGLSLDDAMSDAMTGTKNRERLQQGDLFHRFRETLWQHQDVTPLLSDEHVSVDGTLIEAWLAHESFTPKDDIDGDGERFHGAIRMQARPIQTAASIARARARRAHSATWDTSRWNTYRLAARRAARHRRRCERKNPRLIHASRSARTRPMMLQNTVNACGQRRSRRTSLSTVMSRRLDGRARRPSTDEPPGTRATPSRRANAT